MTANSTLKQLERTPSAVRYRQMRTVTLVGSAVDLVLGVVKLVVGWAAQSQALIADGVHSLSDLITDVVVVLAAKHSQQEADEDHPYGHGRIETVASVAIGVALILVGVGITYDATYRLFHPELLLKPEFWALLAAAFSVLCKEAVYRYTLHHARKLRSTLLRANAWHSRSDALSSIVVIVGVAGAMAGLGYVDAIAAAIVAVMVSKIGWDIGWSSVRELVDTGLEPHQVQLIRERIIAVDGVAALHMLRTRKMGGKALIDVHIILDNARLSVSEGHQISEMVRTQLIEGDADVIDVTVHIDPEDDEKAALNEELPLRSELLGRFEATWREIDGGDQIIDITLHYLEGDVFVDVLLPLELTRDRDAAELRSEEFSRSVVDDAQVASVRLLYR